MSALLNSFALWGGRSVLFFGLIVGYSLHVETPRHDSRRMVWRTRRHSSALPIMGKPH